MNHADELAQVLANFFQPQRTIFDQQEDLERLRAFSRRDLLGHLGQPHPQGEQALVFRAMLAQDKQQALHDLIELLGAPSGPPASSLACVRVLRDLRPTELPQGGGVGLLGGLFVLSEDPHPHAELCHELLMTLEHFRERLPYRKVVECLERLAADCPGRVRCRALKILGRVGEIDVIERVCMLPMQDPDELAARRAMVDEIAARSINLVRLHPHHFEHLMAHLWRKQGHRDVRVTRASGDGGVDITATYGEGRPVLIQCKRYDPSYALKKKDVVAFANSLFTFFKKNPKQPFRAVFVATTEHAPAEILEALAPPHEGAWEVELVLRNKLQAALDDHMGLGRYQIKSVVTIKGEQQTEIFG